MLSPDSRAAGMILPNVIEKLLSSKVSARQSQNYAIPVQFRLDLQTRRVAIARLKTVAHVCQAESVLPRDRRIRIKGILDHEPQIVRRAPPAQKDLAAFDQRRNSMLDGVFDERLHDEWGHIAIRAVLIDILHHMQPV